jgi:hypothetical protein
MRPGNGIEFSEVGKVKPTADKGFVDMLSKVRMALELNPLTLLHRRVICARQSPQPITCEDAKGGVVCIVKQIVLVVAYHN